MYAANQTIQAITEEIRDATLQVHSAQERAEERDIVEQAHRSVEKTANHYREFLASLPEADMAATERLLGRRVSDLKRLAALLPKAVSVVTESTPDRRSGGGTVEQRRVTGVSWASDRLREAPPRDRPAVRVGGEVDAWCGKCVTLTSHHVFAMVDDKPRQVICQVCHSRHVYRTEPARRAGAAAAAATISGRSGKTTAEIEAEKKAEMMRALSREVAAATDAPDFNPKSRYKAGQIIFHPDFGRGKIENVLRSSLLVRFPTSGLKSLMMF